MRLRGEVTRISPKGILEKMAMEIMKNRMALTAEVKVAHSTVYLITILINN